MHLYKKIKNSVEYYYLRETERVNGKVVCKFQKYIGNKKSLFQAIQNGINPIEKIIEKFKIDSVVYHFGAIATLLQISKQISLFDIIDKHMPKRKQDMPISHYLMTAAINRSIKTKSKRAIAAWLNKTSLPFLLEQLDISKLTSQSFWNNMDTIKQRQIYKAEDEITKNVVNKYSLNLDSVLYDSTNYYSYVHTFNVRNKIDQRGKNKQKRNDLRQVNFSLLVTKEHHIPLYHKVYEGNINDYTSFQNTVLELKKKKELLCKKTNEKENFTIIFDAGNVSRENMNLIKKYKLKFISKLDPAGCKELLKIENKEYRSVTIDKEKNSSEIKIYETERELYGSKKKVVIKYNQTHYEAEYKTIQIQIKKTTTMLQEICSRLQKYLKEKRLPSNVTEKTIENSIRNIFSGKTYLRGIIDLEIIKTGEYLLLHWDLNQKKLQDYCKVNLGKTIYFTNKIEMSGEEIVQTYSYQSKIEKMFKISKDRKGGCWWPKFHWTDQKIMVHAFYCYISLLLLSLLEFEVSKLGVDRNVHNIVDELHYIFEIVDHYSNSRNKVLSVKRYSKLNDFQKKLFKHFELQSYFKK